MTYDYYKNITIPIRNASSFANTLDCVCVRVAEGFIIIIIRLLCSGHRSSGALILYILHDNIIIISTHTLLFIGALGQMTLLLLLLLCKFVYVFAFTIRCM